MLKKERAGFYYHTNKGNEMIDGRTDWEKVHLYKIDYKTWGYCLDKGMTKGCFPSLKQLRSYLQV